MHIVILSDPAGKNVAVIERALQLAWRDARLSYVDSADRLLAAIAQADIDLVITDAAREGGGRALVEQARQHRPDVPLIVFDSAPLAERNVWAADGIALDVIRLGAADYVTLADASRLGPAALAAVERTQLSRARLAAEAELLLALKQKTSLIEELYHRVNNNLQLVTSFLVTEARRTYDEAARARLEAINARVHAIALVQEKLYRSGNFSDVDVGSYLRELAEKMTDGSGIAVAVRALPVRLGIGRAVPFGLVANELIVNAMKHAFAGVRDPRLMLSLDSQDDTLELLVEDNGRGIDSARADTDRTGMRLLNGLAQQLGGALTLSPRLAGGTAARLSFPRNLP